MRTYSFDENCSSGDRWSQEKQEFVKFEFLEMKCAAPLVRKMWNKFLFSFANYTEKDLVSYFVFLCKNYSAKHTKEKKSYKRAPARFQPTCYHYLRKVIIIPTCALWPSTHFDLSDHLLFMEFWQIFAHVRRNEIKVFREKFLEFSKKFHDF